LSLVIIDELASRKSPIRRFLDIITAPKISRKPTGLRHRFITIARTTRMSPKRQGIIGGTPVPPKSQVIPPIAAGITAESILLSHRPGAG